MNIRKTIALLAVVLLISMQSIPCRAAQKPFQHGVDTWYFSNTPMMLGGYYRLTEEDTTVMERSYSHTEKRRFNDALHQKWQGCCYGMAVSVLLSYYGVFQPSDYWPNASCLHDVRITEPLISMINYYQHGQCSDALRQEKAWSLYYETSEDRLKMLLALVKAGKPALLGYVGHFMDSDTVSAHAVAAVGYEEGDWTWSEKSYNARILIYDSSSYLMEEKLCLYYQTESGNWCVPVYKLDSEDGDEIDFVTGDVELLNHHGLLQGTYYTSGKPHFAFLNTIMPKGDYTCTKTSYYSGNWVDTQDDADIKRFQYTYGNSLTFSNLDFIAPDLQSGYLFSVKKEQPLDVSMGYEGLLMMAEGTAQTIRFSPDRTFAIESSGQPYQLEIVSDANYPGTLYDITVSGSAKTAQLSVTENGYILHSDDLENVTVKANGDGIEDTLRFSANAGEVLIYETDEHSLAAAIDTDGNGTFETLIAESYDLGNVNQDGAVNAKDATEVLIAAAHIGTGQDAGLTDSGLKAADVNQDGKINAVDATWILQYAAAIGTGSNVKTIDEFISMRSGV